MPVLDEFAQLQLHFVDSIQHAYEVIRPIMLFAETIAARSLKQASSELWWARKPTAS